MIQLYAKNRMPGKKKQAQEVTALREDMSGWVTTLVPLDKEELDLFSLSQDKQVVQTGMAGVKAKGVFTTIFQEPVVAYSYKRYLGEKVNELLLAKTAEHEYIYWTRNGESTLSIDGQEVGKISADRILYGAKSGKEIARIKSQPQDNFLPVSVGNRDVGSLNTQLPSKEDALSQRAFEFIPGDLSQQEEQLFLALVTRELVKQGLPNK
ncbi:hypothetical protein CEQ90_12540 [Lewinellaceae bacterium SD302]|nr:hypothetical protein CEQ90_12540 [Lewinellaceae bacterium SD302]